MELFVSIVKKEKIYFIDTFLSRLHRMPCGITGHWLEQLEQQLEICLPQCVDVEATLPLGGKV